MPSDSVGRPIRLREQMDRGFLFDQTKAMWLSFNPASIMNGSDAQQEVLFHLWHLPAADDWGGLMYLFIDYACMMDERRPWMSFVYACIAGLLVASGSSCQERVLDINRPFSNI